MCPKASLSYDSSSKLSASYILVALFILKKWSSYSDFIPEHSVQAASVLGLRNCICEIV